MFVCAHMLFLKSTFVTGSEEWHSRGKLKRHDVIIQTGIKPINNP